MGYLADVALFPLLFWLLAGGCGLLAERLTGTRLPVQLVAPLGFAVLIVVSQFTTWVGAIAPLTPIVLALLALVGYVLARTSLRARWAARGPWWWLAPAAAIAVYVLVAAPEIVAGRPTFSGYLLDTTGAVQLSGAERLLHYGHSFSGPPAYGSTLAAYFGNGYPSGGHSVLASVGWLSGQNLIWLYSIYQALELSMLALVLVFLARRAGLRKLPAAVTGVVAAVPALLYAYALMGSIKEITALPMLVLMGALIACARRLRAAVGLRAVLPFGLAAAAALDSIGIAASPWVGLFGLFALCAAVPIATRRDVRPWLLGGVGLVLATGILGLPTTGPLGKTLKLAEGVSNSNSLAAADPGNLLRPLKFIQALGVWLGETHRVEPRYLNQTYILLGIVGVCLALGLVHLLRRRSWSLLAFVAGALIAWWFAHRHGTEWTDAKLLVILTPTLVFLAMVGAFGLLERGRPEGWALAAVLAVGVLASDALLYHATNLAPTGRYEELAEIGERYAGKGPTLVPDFDEYSLYLLRKTEVDMPGAAYSGAFEFEPGSGKSYGHSYDLDQLTLSSVERFKTIVMRRSPAWSRPPGNYGRVWQGRYYSVWRRQGPAPAAHFPLGEGGWEPASKPSCKSVAQVALAARRLDARIDYSPRPPNVSMNLGLASHSANVEPSVDLEGRPELNFSGPGRVEGGVRITTPGRYVLWLGGTLDRPMSVYVDGRLAGAPSQQSGDDGTTIYVTTLTLSAGHHAIALVRHGGDLGPDDALSTGVDGVVFEPYSATPQPVDSVAAAQWRSLCGQSLDWIEIA
jgi:hypothetical protein